MNSHNNLHINPYATWSTSGAGQSGNARSPTPSVHGALPFAVDPTLSHNLLFYFTAFNPTILNCTVVGKNTVPYFKVSTDASMSGYTSVKILDGAPIALIEWKERPLVEIRKAVSKTRVGEWLVLSKDASHRKMSVSNQTYIWTPRKNTICLYEADTPTPELLAQITREQDGTVSLEISQTAVAADLLERCVLATVLLQCGKKID
ncbi:hypothetical protein FB45DRAFT_738567 [Roridomyces roridus]|uniref:DUF6593 domain-containing protein n=1 Tax=Roridomyces roridus TaxID=1738132 RepID=A0AAD7C924_9AGAR|nr:hypothetical protein FB45DRAFT_738567 [Roridomyces roridus]